MNRPHTQGLNEPPTIPFNPPMLHVSKGSHRVAVLQGSLYGPYEVRHGLLDDFEGDVSTALHVLDPSVGLALRVDHERPTVRTLEHYGVLDGHAVVGELVDDPSADLHLVPKRLAKGEGRGAGDATSLQVDDKGGSNENQMKNT